jgi:hypothetical protein
MPPVRNSSARLLAGVVLVIVALVTALYGFLSLTRVLDGGGYGTPAMRWALAQLGTAGALMAAGISTLIWDIAKRFETSGASLHQR